jgi:hypothetical protein
VRRAGTTVQCQMPVVHRFARDTRTHSRAHLVRQCALVRFRATPRVPAPTLLGLPARLYRRLVGSPASTATRTDAQRSRA